jgi:hypothetical protein
MTHVLVLSEARTLLPTYEQARELLARCVHVDEAANIANKAQAMAAYLRQARDAEVMQWASEIAIRAQRRAGELLEEAARTGQRDAGGGNRRAQSTRDMVKLADLGITPMQSSRWQALANLSPQQFETAIIKTRKTGKMITRAAVLREARPPAPAPIPQSIPEYRPPPVPLSTKGGLFASYARLAIRQLQEHGPRYTEDEYEMLFELAMIVGPILQERQT